MTARLGCLLLSLVAGCSSLIVSPSVARPAALTSAAAARHPSPVAQQELVGNLEKLSAEDKAAIVSAYTNAVAAGDFETAAVVVGEAAGLIHAIQPAGEIVAQLMRETEACLANPPGLAG